jgi:urate oxidase
VFVLPSFCIGFNIITSTLDTMAVNLAAARYGKDNIRICRVLRDQEAGTQSVVDMTVCAMLEGEIEDS